MNKYNKIAVALIANLLILSIAIGKLSILGSMAGAVVVAVFLGVLYPSRDVQGKQKQTTKHPITLGELFLLFLGITGGYHLIWYGIIFATGRDSYSSSLSSMTGQMDTYYRILYFGLIVPICEEIIYRVAVIKSLREDGTTSAIFCSAVLFGVLHGNALQIPYGFLCGMVLGYVAVNYSVRYAIFFHIFHNLVIGIGMEEMLSRIWADEQWSIWVTRYCLMSVLLAAGIICAWIKRRQIREFLSPLCTNRIFEKKFFKNSGIIICILMGVISACL